MGCIYIKGFKQIVIKYFFILFFSGQYLVRVRAQVMTRDDSTGGWVPLGGGGLSNVSVCKRTQDKNEYLIHGKRISDQSVINYDHLLLLLNKYLLLYCKIIKIIVMMDDHGQNYAIKVKTFISFRLITGGAKLHNQKGL